MKVKDLFYIDNGIFSTIFSTEFATAYKTIFGDVLPQSMDVYVLKTFGEKTLIDYLTTDNYKDVVNSVIALNVDGWTKQAELMQTDYDVLNPTTTTTTETTDTGATGTETGESVTSNKVYNDNDFNQNSKDNDNRQTERKETKSVERVAKGLGNSDFSTAIQKEINFRLQNWRKSITFALINEITTEIY